MAKKEFSWYRAKVDNTFRRNTPGAITAQRRIDAVYGEGAFRRKKIYLDKVSGERRTTIEIYGI